jgi:Icc protein
LCIITGDISNSGDLEAYHDFREILQQLLMSYHSLGGNHDHRDIFAEIFRKSHLTSMVLCNKC